MLSIRFSNRFEVLRDALLLDLSDAPTGVFDAHQIVVPSAAVRRDLTLSIARAHGVCANVAFVYLAQWLWRRIAEVLASVDSESPFASSVLVWRIYELLQEGAWTERFPRLEKYLKQTDPVVRWDLACETASLFEQYITFRQPWLSAWTLGRRIEFKRGVQRAYEDQDWQAEIWRRITADLGAQREHPAADFFRAIQTAGTPTSPAGLPQSVHVFCLPSVPPLYIDMLAGLGRLIDVRIYALNPCPEYWFEIVEPSRLSALALRGKAVHHETGNRLLAAWGQQTQAQIELLLERSGDAPIDETGYRRDFSQTLLGRVQESIYVLGDLPPGSLQLASEDRSIEIHVCHSLTRELEVLQDQLLGLFAGTAPPDPSQVLVVTPDLETAAPLIEAVFGNASADRYLTYTVSGRGRSTVNAPARALLEILALLQSRFSASAVLDLLQQPIVGRRFGIVGDLSTIQSWLRESGIRWGADADHRLEYGLPALDRFNFDDGLQRLFLGYALPDSVAEPALRRVPAGHAEGSAAALLGLFSYFCDRLIGLRRRLSEPLTAESWRTELLEIVDTFLAPADAEIEDAREVRAAISELHGNMLRARSTLTPLSVLHRALEGVLDDAAHGGVPTGTITFSSMNSLRNLPFRVICIIGLDDGAFPGTSHVAEFDLIAADPRPGDRQRRRDDRNVFLDLLLAARERLYLSYTGRSIRDNAILPPSVLISELIEWLVPAIAESDTRWSLSNAHRRLVVEHPLQAFAMDYFTAAGDPRVRSFNRELYDARCRSLAPRTGDGADLLEFEGGAADDFFTGVAAPGPEWRAPSLDTLIRFFKNPAQFLLRERLGIEFAVDEEGVADDEPFLPDYISRRVLADRLLPHLRSGGDRHALAALARAGIEYPPGQLGDALLEEEIGFLSRFAGSVARATQSPCLPPKDAMLSFEIDGEAWELSTVLTHVRPTGLVRERYDDVRPTDYLTGWLQHLFLCAAAPDGVARETTWISRDGIFRLGACDDAEASLLSVLKLYRRGLVQPIQFFPKSAWAYIKSGRRPAAALAKWRSDFGVGESEHPAYRLLFRGRSTLIDADFEACAEAVFGSIGAYIADDRLKSLRA